MSREALRREALAWFKSRLAADDVLDDLRATARHLQPVRSPGVPGPRRPRAKTHAA